MRKLHSYEIETLTNQHCTSDDWGKIEVDNDFVADFVQNVQFLGQNKIGKFNKIFKLENGVKRHSGIFNATLHNCIVSNDVYIADIHNVIANYELKQGCFITNIGTLSKTSKATFGNGVFVAALNENGGRKIPIFEQLSAQIACMLVFYRQQEKLLSPIFKQIEKICERQKKLARGVVGEQAQIMNCKAVLNVKIGAGAVVSGAELLENGTVSSDLTAQTLVGSGVIAKDFIFAKGVKVTDGALIERCFAGEGSIISKHFSATDCLFFANCEMLNGEAVSVFAAPYSVSHHKSNLLIANALSFANIGSGTNMSNHSYKLGAVHQNITERGCKFGSNSYLLSPAHIGAYTLILGSHKSHPDIADLPFSYLVEENGQSVLIPAVNIFRLGTLRDVEKWQKRDRRHSENHLDAITFDFLNPFIFNKILKGIEILEKLKNEKPDAEFYEYGNCKIHSHSLKKGIEYYKDATVCFLGDYLISHDAKWEIEKNVFNFEDWVDIAGLTVPREVYYSIFGYLFDNENVDFQVLKQNFLSCEKMYFEMKSYFIDNFIVDNSINKNEILKKYIEILKKLILRLKKEANSEFFDDAKISFGIDFENQKDADFKAVRGDIDTNEFLKNISADFQNKIEKAEKFSQIKNNL
jgi:hypothetical protein